MERYREDEMTESRAERPVNARRAYAKYNEKRDLPLLLAVRNSQFITNRQLCAQLLADGTETSRRGFAWRASRLVDLGLIETLPHQFPYSGIVYTITRSGVACLEACGEGLVSQTSGSKNLANRSQTRHYLELGEIRAALRGVVDPVGVPIRRASNRERKGCGRKGRDRSANRQSGAEPQAGVVAAPMAVIVIPGRRTVVLKHVGLVEPVLLQRTSFIVAVLL